MPVCVQTSAWTFLSKVLRTASSELQLLQQSKGGRYYRTYYSRYRQRAIFLHGKTPLNSGDCFVAKTSLTSEQKRLVDITTFTFRQNMSSSTDSMPQRMVWVDLEMTGLDIDKDQIIEMACIITDSELNVLAEGPNLIINQSNELLDGMSDWCKEHHGQSGLTQAVRDSKISLQQAEYEFLSFVRQHTPPGQCPLAGNSVHADKKFLDKFMPQFMYHLHYRIIDVSTIKELCRRWFPKDYRLAPQKKASHRALDDIQESIKELQFYRLNVFKTEADEKKRKVVENGNNVKSM